MRNYTAAKILSEAWQRVRIKRAVEDPYEVVQRRLKRAAEEILAKETPRLAGLWKRPPTKAALLADFRVMFTQERGVSVDLTSKPWPASWDISQSLGFAFIAAYVCQVKAFAGLISAVLCTVHRWSPEILRK
jgi:hypothetical protein